MPLKGRKNTLLNNGEGLTESDPQIQEVMEELSKSLQENPPPAASTEPMAASESATLEGYEETLTEANQTQITEPVGY